MRKLGIIGGMSWVSTRTYYEHINRYVQKREAKMASAPMLIESLDFSPLYGLVEEADWERAADVLSESAKRLEQAGVGAIVIGANSMHRMYDQIASAVAIPILHIADSVGERMAGSHLKTAALIGTRNVMTESFYRERLIAHGVELLAPDMEHVEEINRIIYDELMVGRTARESERTMRTIITHKEKSGAEAIILACTELELIVDVNANILPIFDCTKIHAEKAAEWVLGAD